jgi:hypothetical protein
MKNARIVFMVFGIAFLMCVVAPIASAQNRPGFAVWTGTFLKLTTTLKGYYYSPTTLNNLNAYDEKISESETQWGIVTGDIAGNFEIAILSKGDSKECVSQLNLPLEYVAGSQVDFVAKFLIDDADTYATGLVYVKAQLDNKTGKIKQGGTISSVAAYTIERGFNEPLDLAANGLTIKGSIVKTLGCTLTNQ